MHAPSQSTEEELKAAWGHLQMVIAKVDQLGIQGTIELGKARYRIEMLKCALPPGRGAQIIKKLEDSDPRKKKKYNQ